MCTYSKCSILPYALEVRIYIELMWSSIVGARAIGLV